MAASGTLDRGGAVFFKLKASPRQPLEGSREFGLVPVKVNTVLMRGINDHEALDLLHYCLERELSLRFIEQMPLDAQHGWDRSIMVTAEEIQSMIASEHALTPVGGRGSSPAEEFYVDGGPATVGIIASVSRPFCGSCDRVRLTADGMFRNCLFATRETDLRAVLRSGGSDDDLATAIAADVGRKWAGHAIGRVEFRRPARSMSETASSDR